MQVIAKKTGYFGVLREAGDTFDVPDEETGSWFEPVATPQEDEVEPDGKEKKGKKKQAADLA